MRLTCMLFSCLRVGAVGQDACVVKGVHLRHLRLGLLLGIGILSGCGSNAAAPVSDVDRATLLITEALDAWQAGASLDDQRKKTPPIYVAEELWLNGTKLEGFEISEPGVVFGTNVRFGVKLSCVDTTGGKRSREVKYLVTTAPALTIAREDR